MQISRSLQFLTAVSAFALVSACSTGRRGPDGYVDANYSAGGGQWDSGPLDRSYQQERDATDVRHTQELANPPAGEDHDQTVARQSAENKDVETRYKQGQASHATSMPKADTKAPSDDNKSDKP